MSESWDLEVGAIGWLDLTVPDAERIRDFYNAVVGWKPSAVSMGDYDDFNMNTPGSGKPMAGVCHARGMNADLPSQWLVYITVEDIDLSVKQCNEQGGKVLVGPKDMGKQGRYCVIQDPAGAVAALFEPAN
jgi:predicted enzyme related to lactoylglutathione lyase